VHTRTNKLCKFLFNY